MFLPEAKKHQHRGPAPEWQPVGGCRGIWVAHMLDLRVSTIGALVVLVLTHAALQSDNISQVPL